MAKKHDRTANKRRSPDRNPGGAPSLSRERQAIEFAKCSVDPAYFTDSYCIIDDAQGEAGSAPFKLWPAQVSVMWQFVAQRLVIVLKARQLGISWLACAYALWLIMFYPGRVVLLFSKKQSDAQELKRRIEILYSRLPDWMREAGPQVTVNNSTTFGFDNESRVESEPATQSAGRGKTASLVIFDEAGFMQWATTLYNAMKPTIDNGGRLIIISTANGLGGLFHKLWMKAAGSANKFAAIFLPWWSRPGRDRAWYNAMLDEATDERLVQQEYPASAAEAFITSGRQRFSYKWIDRQMRHIRPGLEHHELKIALERQNTARAAEKLSTYTDEQQTAILDLLKIPGIAIYAPPEPGRAYIVGADVAEGKINRDYSAGVLIDKYTRIELLSIHGHYEPDQFGNYLVDIASAYNTALLGPERNNHGHATIAAIKRRNYPQLANGHDGDPGWLTNSQTKPLIIDGLAEDLRDGLITIYTEAALNECLIYEIKPDGKTGAPDGDGSEASDYHDDYVMALGITRQLAITPPAEATSESLPNLWKRNTRRR